MTEKKQYLGKKRRKAARKRQELNKKSAGRGSQPVLPVKSLIKNPEG